MLKGRLNQSRDFNIIKLMKKIIKKKIIKEDKLVSLLLAGIPSLFEKMPRSAMIRAKVEELAEKIKKI